MTDRERQKLFYTEGRFDAGKTARLFELDRRQKSTNDVLLRVALREALLEITRLQDRTEEVVPCSVTNAGAAPA